MFLRDLQDIIQISDIDHYFVFEKSKLLLIWGITHCSLVDS